MSNGTIRPINVSTVATEADMVDGNAFTLDTPGKLKKLPANLVAKASEQAALTTYAQNVAHSIAPEYNGTTGAVAGKLYMHEGTLYRCKVNTSGAWVHGNFMVVALSDFAIKVGEHQGFLTSSGTYGGGNSYHCYVTNKLPVAEGDKIKYRGVGRSSAVSALFYDSANEVLSSVQQNTPNEFVEITVPSNAVRVILSSFSEADKDIDFDFILPDSQLYLVYKNILSLKSQVSVLEASPEFVRFNEAVGYMLDNGNNNTAATSSHCIMTELLPAVEGDVFYYIGDGHALAYSVVFYNSSKTVIEASQVSLSSSFTAITCPANTAYVKFSSFAPIADPIPFALVKKDSQLDGLRLYFDDVITGLVGDINDDVFRVKSQYQMFAEYKGLMTNTGEPNNVSTYHCYITDKIKASAGDKFLYRGEGRSLAMSAVFFNSSNAVIGTAQYQSQYSYTEITCPANTAYVKFSSFNNASDPILLSVVKKGSELEALLHDIGSVSSDELKGKKWYACGDSFTHGDFTGITAPSIPSGKYAGQLPVYPYLIGNRTECEVSNIAVNGSTIAQPSDSSFNNVFTKPTTGLLYTTDFSDADYITLYFGINDSHKSVPIGTIDDNDNTTFYGAWNVVLDYLTDHYPAAHIGIIISNGCDTADYPTAVEAIAKKWGIHYLDLDGGVGCQTMLRCSSRNPASAAIKARRLEQQRISSSNSHPNEYAHEFESHFIEAWLKTL